MERDIEHTDKFESGAYILNEGRIPYAPLTSGSNIFLTQEGNNSLKKEILKLIDESNDVLKICSFIITDKEVYEAILNKAKYSNTSVFILTQLDQSKLVNTSLLTDFLTEEEIKEDSSRVHLNFIKNLFEQGVHVRASTVAHAKFIVSDRRIGFLTSANLTTPSLTFNMESGLYLEQSDVKDLDMLFDAIFQKGTRYRQYLIANKRKTFVVQAETNIEPKHLPNIAHSNLRYTYESETDNLYRALVKLIEDATQYLYISSYSIVGLDKLPELCFAISEAVKRGVKVNVFCRGMNYRNDHLMGSSILKSIGCGIFADLFNHSKGLINEKSGIIFTANIDGNHGLKNGFEVGYLLNENKRLEFLDIHKHLIETSIYKYEGHPSRTDLFQTYETYEKAKAIKAPVFSNNITILIKDEHNINPKDFIEQPIFYAKSKDSNFLMAGRNLYKCNYKDGIFDVYEKENIRFDLEKYILKYSKLKIISN